MKVIITDGRHGISRSFTLGRRAYALLCLGLLGLPLSGALLYGLWAYIAQGAMPGTSLSAIREEVNAQGRAVVGLQAEAERRLRGLGAALAAMEARLVRLDATGQRLVELAGLDDGEFDFSRSPGLGGPLVSAGAAHGSQGQGGQAPDMPLDAGLGDLAARMADRERQLGLLALLLVNRQLQAEVSPAGAPITKGWLSSAFGWRKDPFNGRNSWHEGVDFAGKHGSDITAVASGVVTWSGEREGYGTMVDISHGAGYSTRYAHNDENLVKVGDIVKQGQVIARMGSSGRSTGPHVHYEVHKHGRSVDPATYIRSNHR